jgi:hypothetical protein
LQPRRAFQLNSASNTEARWLTPSARLAKGSDSTNIISLNAIRREAGSGWEKMREAICARLETLFRQRLGPSDFFVPVDQSSYLVVMPSSTLEEGQICCLRLSYDLHVSLLGACGVEHLEISRASSVSDDVLELCPFSRLEIVQMAEKAELALAPPGSGGLCADKNDLRALQLIPCRPIDVEIKFLPVWDSQFQVIRAYRCIYNRTAVGSAGLTLKEEAQELAQMALTALTRVSEVLQNHLAHNERFMVNMTVSYAVLTSPLARMEFIAACRCLPCELRPYLVFKLEGFPHGVPHGRLIELLTAISPFCGAVIAKVPRTEHAIDIYSGVGLKALGMGLGSASLSSASAAIERLCAVAKREKLCTFLDDVPDVPTLRFALASGVTWISGAAVLPPVIEPGPLLHVTLDALIDEVAA